MANELDEKTGPVNKEGRDVNVIDKQLEVKTGAGTIVFIVFLFILGLIPGFIWLGVKASRQSYLDGLQQKIQGAASQIDNYIVQKGDILQNAADLLGKSIKLDKSVFTDIAKARSGITDGKELSAKNAKVEQITRKVQVAFEQYPNLKSHDMLADCLQKCDYLTREITAARDVYNDTILEWNTQIFKWPTNKYIAGKRHWTTRVPFIASAEQKANANKRFFKE